MPPLMPFFRHKLSRASLAAEEPAPAHCPASAMTPPSTPPPSTPPSSTPPRHNFDAVAPPPAPLPIPSKSKSSLSALTSSLNLSSTVLPASAPPASSPARSPASSPATSSPAPSSPATASTAKTHATASSVAAPTAASQAILRPPRPPPADALGALEARLSEALSRPRSSPSLRGPSRATVPILIEFAVTGFVTGLAPPTSAAGFTDIKGWLLLLVQSVQMSRWREAVWTLSSHVRYESCGFAYSLEGDRGADVRLVGDTGAIRLFCKEVTRAVLAQVPGMDRNRISANAGRQSLADQKPLNFFKIAHFFVALQLWDEFGTVDMKTAVESSIEALRTSTGADVDQSGAEILRALNGLSYSKGFPQWLHQDDNALLACLGSGGGMPSSPVSSSSRYM